MSFYTGQKVVHVGFEPWSLWERVKLFFHPIPLDRLEVGAIYTVVNVIRVDDEDFTLELFEEPAPETSFWEAGFTASGFRPAVETQTDISIFTRMLTPTKERVS